MWAHHTVENGGGVSESWMTPNTMDTLDPKPQDALNHEYTHREGRSNPNNLRDHVAVQQGERNWPTPQEDDSSNVNPKPNRRPGLVSKVNETGNWPTPIAAEAAGPNGQVELSNTVQNWPTPTANEDAAGLPNGNMQKMLGNHPQLRNVTAQSWGTPTARDWKGTSPAATIRKDGKSRMHLLPYMVEQSQFGHQGQTNQTNGEESLQADQTSPRPSPKTLSPIFVEWMMGVPTGWTSLKPLETESFLQWLQNFSEE